MESKDFDNLKKSIAQARTMKSIMEENEQLEKDLAEAQKLNSELGTDCVQLQQTINCLDGVKAELDAANKRIARLTAHAKAGDEEFEALEKERDELKAMIKNDVDGITMYQGQIADLKARAGWTENQRQLLIAEANSRGSEILKLAQSNDAMREACEELCSKAFVDAERTQFIIPPAFEKAVRLAKAAIQKEGK